MFILRDLLHSQNMVLAQLAQLPMHIYKMNELEFACDVFRVKTDTH
jgi:hypothetical protein